MARDLTKTFTFATLHFGVGFGVTYALTGSAAIATGVALIEPLVNTVVFFLHERAWQHIGAKRGNRPARAPAPPGGALAAA
ncbi:MAG: DUF2061 domain-containing protein [Rhodospirillaceae bacterium]|nr:DUF2061 domain-containing protein [Rhodospirillaceae bacterium]